MGRGGWPTDPRASTRREPVRVAVVQGNIAQDEKWNPALRDQIIGRYLAMTQAGRRAGGARSSSGRSRRTPSTSSEDLARRSSCAAWPRETGATLLVGSDQVEPIAAGRAARATTIASTTRRSSSSPTGDGRGLPQDAPGAVRRVRAAAAVCCSSSAPLVDAVSDFTPGDRPVLLPVGDHLASTAICYEVDLSAT